MSSVPTQSGDPRLHTELAGLSLTSPVILAAGTAGTLDEFSGVLDLSRVGALVTKSITRHSRQGNPTWRIIETKTGMLNAIGLANPGLDAFVEHIAPRIPAIPTQIIPSIAGFSIDDFVRTAASMDLLEGIAAVELNVSCPNVEHGCEFGADPALLRELITQVRPALPHTRLFVKLSPVAIGTPNTIVDLARAAIETQAQPAGPNQRTGADALTIANTIPAMAIDVESRKPRLANITGGLSGPAIHPITLRLVYEAHRHICAHAGIPIIALGGVLGWRDAAEFILAGASAVGIGTGLFANPRLPYAINKGLAKWTRSQGVENLSQLVGKVDIP